MTSDQAAVAIGAYRFSDICFNGNSDLGTNRPRWELARSLGDK